MANDYENVKFCLDNIHLVDGILVIINYHASLRRVITTCDGVEYKNRAQKSEKAFTKRHEPLLSVSGLTSNRQETLSFSWLCHLEVFSFNFKIK